jgi:HEAT repeat protein
MKPKIFALLALLLLLPAVHVLAEAVSFEQTVAGLKSAKADARVRAVEMLRDAAYPEAAVPLAGVITDPADDVRLSAIAAELNIFLAEKVSSKKRVAFVIERRGKIAADAAFSAGRSVVGTRIVPRDVPLALAAAMNGENPRVSFEAVYAFGTLAPEVAGPDRPAVLRAAAPHLAALLGSLDDEMRLAALRVAARVYEHRVGDEPADQTLGDAIIAMLNDGNADVRASAMLALGVMRYDRGVQALGDLLAYYRKGDAFERVFDALARIGSPGSVGVFEERLSSREAPLKAMAIEGLARVGDPAAMAKIEAATTAERNESVLLARAFAAATLAEGPIDPLVDALARPKLHDQAIAYLIELAPGRARLFAQGTHDPDPRVRADIVDLLGIAGDRSALPAVEPMTSDADPQVARAAARAVARLRAAA